MLIGISKQSFDKVPGEQIHFLVPSIKFLVEQDKWIMEGAGECENRKNGLIGWVDPVRPIERILRLLSGE